MAVLIRGLYDKEVVYMFDSSLPDLLTSATLNVMFMVYDGVFRCNIYCKYSVLPFHAHAFNCNANLFHINV